MITATNVPSASSKGMAAIDGPLEAPFEGRAVSAKLTVEAAEDVAPTPPADVDSPTAVLVSGFDDPTRVDDVFPEVTGTADIGDVDSGPEEEADAKAAAGLYCSVNSAVRAV